MVTWTWTLPRRVYSLQPSPRCTAVETSSTARRQAVGPLRSGRRWMRAMVAGACVCHGTSEACRRCKTSSVSTAVYGARASLTSLKRRISATTVAWLREEGGEGRERGETRGMESAGDVI